MFIKQPVENVWVSLFNRGDTKVLQKTNPFLMLTVSFQELVSSHDFYLEFRLTPLHRLLILPLRPRMWKLQSNSQPGNKMSAFKYFRFLRTSHPRHLDRVSSSLKCISPKMFLTSKGIGMSSSLCLEFLFATHICVKKDGLCCEISHWTLIVPEIVPI